MVSGYRQREGDGMTASTFKPYWALGQQGFTVFNVLTESKFNLSAKNAFATLQLPRGRSEWPLWHGRVSRQSGKDEPCFGRCFGQRSHDRVGM